MTTIRVAGNNPQAQAMQKYPAPKPPIRSAEGTLHDSMPVSGSAQGSAQGFDPIWPSADRKMEITCGYGKRRAPAAGASKFHEAIDIHAPKGTAILAVAPGQVVSVGPISVKIKHENGMYTEYYHLRNIKVRVGDRVEGGQQIGRTAKVGPSTGAHLDFRMYNCDNRKIDPTPYFAHYGTDVTYKKGGKPVYPESASAGIEDTVNVKVASTP